MAPLQEPVIVCNRLRLGRRLYTINFNIILFIFTSFLTLQKYSVFFDLSSIFLLKDFNIIFTFLHKILKNFNISSSVPLLISCLKKMKN